MKKSSKGFTLLELLVVIVLLVMAISVTSVSIVSGQDGARMKTSASQLVSVLRSARVRAITDGVEAGITLGLRDLDLENESLENQSTENRTTENHSPQHRDDNRAYTIVPTGEQVTLPDTLSLSLTSTDQQGIIAPGSIMFYPDGSSSGGRLELSAPAGTMTLDVNWLTGEVVLDNGNAVSEGPVSEGSTSGSKDTSATVQ